MKRLLFSALFAACAAVGFSSCMNGDYDANPDAANTAPNPLANNNNNGGSTDVGIAQKGQIRCLVNGQPLILNNAQYTDIVGRIISGSVQNGNIEKAIDIVLTDYTGTGTYQLGAAVTGLAAGYTVTDYSVDPNGKHYSTEEPGGNGEAVITTDANNEMIGTFHYEAFNNGEKVSVTNGSFDVLKP